MIVYGGRLDNQMFQYIFPTVIWNTPMVDNFESIQDEIEQCLDQEDFQLWDNMHYLSDLNFNQNLIKKHKLNYLNDEISKYLNAYVTETYFFGLPYNILSAWFSLYKKGNYSRVHDHGLCDISGVYYFKTSGSDANLFFKSPIPQGSQDEIQVSPSEGQMLLFPGWLKHGVGTNASDNERISISFNISFDRTKDYE